MIGDEALVELKWHYSKSEFVYSMTCSSYLAGELLIIT